MSDRLGRRPIPAASAILGACMLLGAGTGCGTIRVTDTPRAATEQLLLTQAWDSAIGAVDFGPIVGPAVVLDDSYLAGPDRGWMVYRIRESMARQGVRLIDDPKRAEVVVEAGAAVFATDSNSCLVGIPSNGLVGAMAGARGLVIPEVALSKKTEQYGVTRLALFARDVEAGLIVWESGTIDADSYLRNASVLGVPMRSGTIDHPSDRRRKRAFSAFLHRLRPGIGHGHGPPDALPLPPLLPPG